MHRNKRLPPKLGAKILDQGTKALKELVTITIMVLAKVLLPLPIKARASAVRTTLGERPEAGQGLLADVKEEAQCQIKQETTLDLLALPPVQAIPMDTAGQILLIQATSMRTASQGSLQN